MDESSATQASFHRWPFFAAAISGLALFVILRCAPRDQWIIEISSVIVGILGVVLVFTLPICVLTVLGHQPVMTLAPLFPTSRQRAKWREMRQRPVINDKEFYQRFYGATGIPGDMPVRLRGVYAEQLGISRVLPNDKATDFDEELDFSDLLFEVAEDFSINFSEEEAEDLTAVGTFDAIVRCVAAKPLTKRDEFYFQPADSDIVKKAVHRGRISILFGLLVAGLVVIGVGFAVSRLDKIVPGIATIIKLAGVVLVVLALARGEYRIHN